MIILSAEDSPQDTLIPRLLAYGANPGTDKIKPFENIMFEVTIIDVKDKVPVMETPQKPGVKK